MGRFVWQYSLNICVNNSEALPSQQNIMKSPAFAYALLSLLLLSCSSYEKVTLANLEEYGISNEEREKLPYVLKTHKLHYLLVDRVDKTNFYTIGESTPYYSRSAIFEENIVIPTGTTGLCFFSRGNQFIIDFGEGIRVPFHIHSDDNRASDRIKLEGRIYKLVPNRRKPTLFFDTRGPSGPDSDTGK